MTRILGTLVALLLIVAFAYPFAQHAYERWLVARRLDAVMTPQERAAFRDWQGDAPSFAKRLYDTCLLNHQEQGACNRYRYAFQER